VYVLEYRVIPQSKSVMCYLYHRDHHCCGDVIAQWHVLKSYDGKGKSMKGNALAEQPECAHCTPGLQPAGVDYTTVGTTAVQLRRSHRLEHKNFVAIVCRRSISFRAHVLQ
jgi:hypothetical protein